MKLLNFLLVWYFITLANLEFVRKSSNFAHIIGEKVKSKNPAVGMKTFRGIKGEIRKLIDDIVQK